MLRRVQKYIRDNELLQRGDRVIVGVSGGADSMALLDVLCRGGYQPIVAHCNFHLRGEESDRDEAFVKDYVQRENDVQRMALFIKSFDTEAYAAETGKSIEMAARELRYRWFFELAHETGAVAVAVAHHQHDQAETVIMNLRRCTGLRALQGMRPKAYTWDSEIPVIRPLLCTTHDYIEHYLRDIRHIDWVVDSTNSDTRIRRNSIRAMMAEWPKADIEHIAKTAEMIQGYIDLIENKNTPGARAIQEYEETRNPLSILR